MFTKNHIHPLRRRCLRPGAGAALTILIVSLLGCRTYDPMPHNQTNLIYDNPKVRQLAATMPENTYPRSQWPDFAATQVATNAESQARYYENWYDRQSVDSRGRPSNRFSHTQSYRRDYRGQAPTYGYYDQHWYGR